MNQEMINKVVNKYVKDNLSPKEKQRKYITKRYEEIYAFLGYQCFQSGSYARFTAINPVHDLDVIFPVADADVQENPLNTINELLSRLKEAYSEDPGVKDISAQTHSVTIEFEDSPIGEFSIDVIPAISLDDETNEYNDPLYLVPEILKLNRPNRLSRYKNANEKPIQWIKSDPRGYIRSASELNDNNKDFRHTAKLLKGWRHACKEAFGDEFRLKSFHLEQIVYSHLIENSGSSTMASVIACLTKLPEYLKEPQIEDRADSSTLIDTYVEELTPTEVSLILRLQTNALAIAKQLTDCKSATEINNLLRNLMTVTGQTSSNISSAPRTIVPQKPWGI